MKDSTATSGQSTSLDQQAGKLLRSRRLVALALRLADRRGVIGEEPNKQMLLLSCVGGLLGYPIHCVVHGASSSGKNTLVVSITDLLPREQLTHVSGLSAQALAYAGREITGVLMIDEAGGMSGGAEYSLRVAMSEGAVSRLTVNKGAGGQWKGQKLEVNFTASVITTTTAAGLHAENQTRVFDLWTDESEALTRRINLALGRRHAAGRPFGGFESSLEVWRRALATLEPLRVVIPYAETLADRFPSNPIRSRRDLPRVLDLIRAHALLHQKQRRRTPNNELVAELADYEAVYPLLQTVLAHTMTGLTEVHLKMDSALRQMAEKKRDGEWVRRVDLEKNLKNSGGPSHNPVREGARQLKDLGYWDGRMRNGAWEYRPVRDAASEPIIALPRPAQLAVPATDYRTGAGTHISISENGLPQPPNDTNSSREQGA